MTAHYNARGTNVRITTVPTGNIEESGDLLYVGGSRDLRGRLTRKEHHIRLGTEYAMDSPKIYLAVWSVPLYDVADVERAMIYTCWPIWNQTFRPSLTPWSWREPNLLDHLNVYDTAFKRDKMWLKKVPGVYTWLHLQTPTNDEVRRVMIAGAADRHRRLEELKWKGKGRHF